MHISHNAGPLITPLKALWRWLMAEPGHGQVNQGQTDQPSALTKACASEVRTSVFKAQAGVSRPVIRAPLRVLRVMEAGQAPAQVGRMRISGRMADVCAELDRLAACESLLH